MSIQTFACPACGSRKALADAQPGEKIHCTCGMSYPASPVFAFVESKQKSPGVRWAALVFVSVVVGTGLSAFWLMARPKPPQTTGSDLAMAAPKEAEPGQPAEPAPLQPPGPASAPTPPQSVPAPPEKLPAPARPSPVASLSAVTLWDAFDLDPAAAANRFNGKVVEIVARGRAAEDTLGRPYFGAVIVNRGGRRPSRLSPEEQQWEKDGYPPNVRCYVTPDQAASLEKLSADGDVIIRGVCTGRKDIDGVYRGYIVELIDCQFVTLK